MSLFVNKYKNYIVKNECAFHYSVVPSARLQLQSTKTILGLSPQTLLYYTFLIWCITKSFWFFANQVSPAQHQARTQLQAMT